jgi:hypothetical protein
MKIIDFFKTHTKDFHATQDNSWLWGILWAVLMIVAVIAVWRWG